MSTIDPKQAPGAAKPQLQLVPPILSVETAKALSCGAAKYGTFNWRGSNKIKLMTYLGAMKRHIDAVIDGEDIDPESGASHFGHIAANCGIILDAEQFGSLEDDRPLSQKSEVLLEVIDSLPEGLPPLPEGAVYLGRGGDFQRHGDTLHGWIYSGGAWAERPLLRGDATGFHYAAPKDSEIAKLNNK